jgi:GT2 family glycosyltransferase
MTLSVVVVTWNAKRFVIECLTSLLAERATSLEVIVVDNGSTDGTPEAVAESFPAVRLIRSQVNLGFAAANNVGMAAAQGEYMCLVNSDVNVPLGCLPFMLTFMRENPDVGLLGPAMLGPDGSVRRSTMRFPTVWNSFCAAIALDSVLARVGLWGGYLMKDFQHDCRLDVDVLNGWFWMTRRSAIADVGVLDERFFIYGEDIDWCRRFHDHGWRVVFNPGSSALHYGGASSSLAPTRFYIELQVANMAYWSKHHSTIARKAFASTLLLHHIARLCGYLAVFALQSGRREEASFKMRRSVASIRWLCGLERSGAEA